VNRAYTACADHVRHGKAHGFLIWRTASHFLTQHVPQYSICYKLIYKNLAIIFASDITSVIKYIITTENPFI